MDEDIKAMAEQFELTITTVGDLTGRDVNRRVVVVEGSNSFDGRLRTMWWSTSQWKDYERRVTIDVEHGLGVLKLSNLPMDFIVQVDRNEIIKQGENE